MARLTPAEVAAINASNAQLKAARAQEVAAKESLKLAVTIKGDKGDPGKDGAPGNDGLRGPRGEDGADGRDGIDGKDGAPGKDGRDGVDGQDGVGPDEKVKVSKDDPTPGFLGDKIAAGNGVTLRRATSKRGGEKLFIDATSSAGGTAVGGAAGLQVYDDGVAVGVGNKVSFDGGDPVSISGGIIHVPVGTAGPGGSDDQTAAEVPFTPAGSISATNVQAAIEEVAAEAGAGTPTLAEVLVEGNDPGGTPIRGADGVVGGDVVVASGDDTVDGATGASYTVGGATAGQGGGITMSAGLGTTQPGGSINVSAGNQGADGTAGSISFSAGSNDDGDEGAGLTLQGGTTGVNGKVSIRTDGSTGTEGQFLKRGEDGAVWGDAPAATIAQVVAAGSDADGGTITNLGLLQSADIRGYQPETNAQYGFAAGITYIANSGGAGGNLISIEYIVGVGNNVPLSVATVGNAITVTLPTDGSGDIIPTLMSDVVDLVNNDVDASDLVTASTDTPGSFETHAEAQSFLEGGFESGEFFHATQSLHEVTRSGLRFGEYAGTDDPSTGGGLEANLLSTYRRDNAGTGELWFKTGAADTDWTFLGASGGTPAADPGDIADPTLATAEDVALKLNALMASMRTAGSLV